ncbi:MAG: hypothetical protein ACKOWF_14745 [Chloroflexota bacterium]
MSTRLVDLVAQALGGSANRRDGLRAAAAAVAAALTRQAAGAAPRPGAEGPCGNGSQRDNACTRDADCCTGVCILPGKDAAASGTGGNRRGKGKHNRGKGKGKGKHRAPAGRCRCLTAGRACADSRNCCPGLGCANGTCRHDKPARPVRLGRPCTSTDTCADDRATCTSYRWGDRAGTGAFCLLATGDSCSGNQQCPTDRCLDGVCAPCSVPACGVACTPIVCASGCEFTTVQAAIDARQGTADSIVAIGAGTWEENLQVAADVTLRGCPGAETVLRNTSYFARTVSAAGPASLTLLDITIDAYADKPGGDYGGGVYTQGDLTIAGTTVIRNAGWDKGAGAYVAADGRTLTITDDAVIENNAVSNAGGGALLEGLSDLVVNGSAILRGNTTDSYGGALAAAYGANVAISGAVRIENNLGGGAGLFLYRGDATRAISVVVEGDVVGTGNAANAGQDGGFARFQNSGTGTYYEMDIRFRDRVRITGNSSTGDGGALSSRWGRITISGSAEFSGNQSTDDGGFAWVAAGGYGDPWPDGVIGLAIEDNATITGNSAASTGGGFTLVRTAGALSSSAPVTGNSTPLNGGGVALVRSTQVASLAISGAAAITGNTANNGGGLWSNDAANVVTGGAAITGNTPDDCAGVTC